MLYDHLKVELNSKRIVGVEALMRWQHPVRGVAQPDEFIPLLEETGLIVPVGRWVLQSACVQHKVWAEQGAEPLMMAVNLSAQQFAQGDLAQMVADTLKNLRSPRQARLAGTGNHRKRPDAGPGTCRHHPA